MRTTLGPCLLLRRPEPLHEELRDGGMQGRQCGRAIEGQRIAEQPLADAAGLERRQGRQHGPVPGSGQARQHLAPWLAGCPNGFHVEAGNLVDVLVGDHQAQRHDWLAQRLIQTQRGRHAVWVFPYRGRRIARMNNSAWQQARRDAGLRSVRVHDLRHTYACRLRAAGVSAEDRAALLGHATQSMVGHYASADVGRLLREANLVLNRQETRTVLRVANG